MGGGEEGGISSYHSVIPEGCDKKCEKRAGIFFFKKKQGEIKID